MIITDNFENQYWFYVAFNLRVGDSFRPKPPFGLSILGFGVSFWVNGSIKFYRPRGYPYVGQKMTVRNDTIANFERPSFFGDERSSGLENFQNGVYMRWSGTLAEHFNKWTGQFGNRYLNYVGSPLFMWKMNGYCYIEFNFMGCSKPDEDQYSQKFLDIKLDFNFSFN